MKAYLIYHRPSNSISRLIATDLETADEVKKDFAERMNDEVEMIEVELVGKMNFVELMSKIVIPDTESNK